MPLTEESFDHAQSVDALTLSQIVLTLYGPRGWAALQRDMSEATDYQHYNAKGCWRVWRERGIPAKAMPIFRTAIKKRVAEVSRGVALALTA